MIYSDLSTGQIRLVRLYSSQYCEAKASARIQNHAPIYCNLFTVDHKPYPKYEALSYRWGSPSSLVPIFVNEEEFPVTTSLHVALLHLRRDNVNVDVWIDQICINQSDDAEKGIQVGQMRDIYSGAETTTVWLGPAKDDSDHAMTELGRLGSYIVDNNILELMVEMSTMATSHPARHDELYVDIKKKLATQFEAAIKDLCGTLATLIATRDLMKRDYWNRVWILQEFAMSPKLRIQCGSRELSLPFDQFYGGLFHTLFMKTHVLSTLAMRNWKLGFQLRFAELDAGLTAFYALVKLNLPSTATKVFRMRRRYQASILKPSERDSLLQILAKAHVVLSGQPIQAFDARDRIHGLLGMAADTQLLQIAPDYSKSCSDIYRDVARAMILSGHIDALSLAQPHQREPGLPSWVPDWRGIIIRPSGQMPWDTSFCASGEDSKQNVSAVCNLSSAQMVLQGCEVDRIEEIGSSWTSTASDRIVCGDSGVPTNNAITKYFKSIGRFCRLSNEKFKENSHDIYSNLYDRPLAPIRVPIADQEQYGAGFIRRVTDSSVIGYQDLMKSLRRHSWLYRAFFFCYTGLRRLVGWLLGRLSQVEAREVAIEHYKNMIGWQQFRAPFISAKGYVGLVPDHATKEDLIVIFLGAKFPYILRKQHDGSFMLVGEAYVNGIMYGEFMKREECQVENDVLS